MTYCRDAYPSRTLGWCTRGCGRQAQREWFRDPEDRLGLCKRCRHALERSKVNNHMRVFRSFAEVDRTLYTGTLIRIENCAEPYWNGVYRIKNGGNNAQGFVWGARVWPGPFRAWGVQGPRPVRLRSWGGDVPPRYRVPGIDEDEDV